LFGGLDEQRVGALTPRARVGAVVLVPEQLSPVRRFGAAFVLRVVSSAGSSFSGIADRTVTPSHTQAHTFVPNRQDLRVWATT